MLWPRFDENERFEVEDVDGTVARGSFRFYDSGE